MSKKLTYEYVKNMIEENGIDLLVIDEQYWINNKEQCLNKIEIFIGVDNNG